MIPLRDNEHVADRERWQPTFDRRAYKQRNVVERAIAKLKEFRRIATRYDKLASPFTGTINVACIVFFLRRLGS